MQGLVQQQDCQQGRELAARGYPATTMISSRIPLLTIEQETSEERREFIVRIER
jgi:hypothetical protein